MKDFDIKKWIPRFIKIVLLFLTYDSIMNYLDKMYEYVLENRNEVSADIDSDSFITMKDLGFEYHDVIDSRIKELDKRIDPNGKYYLLKMDNDDANHYVYISLGIYQASTEDIALEIYESLVKVAYKNDVKGIECHIGTCAIPNIDFETTIQYMVPIDLNVWDVDQGYALKECFTDESNTIILLKDNQVMIIDHWDNSSLNSSHAQIFVDLFDKTDAIFE